MNNSATYLLAALREKIKEKALDILSFLLDLESRFLL